MTRIVIPEKEYKKDLKKVVRRLQKLHIPALAEETGINKRWLYRVADEEIARPNKVLIKQLAEYLEI